MVSRYQEVVARIDAINQEDPTIVQVKGEDKPEALAYGIWVSDWVKYLNPEASDALLIAARGIHLLRWTIKRDTYPTGPAGYATWRQEVRQLSADTLGHMLHDMEYDRDVLDAIWALIARNNPEDADMQTLQDAIGLAFLEWQLNSFVAKYDTDKVIRALQGTYARMSDKAQKLALDLEFSPNSREILERALMGGDF
jgi:hypothetical protein